VREVLAELHLEPLKDNEVIDCGAEEELYRRVGQQAAGELLAMRWKQADAVVEAKCGQCERKMKAIGARRKQVRTVCGEVHLERKVFYCPECRQTRVPLDERLGITETRITPGLSRIVCRSALELPYGQSQQLLTDSLGFEPCSAREIERIANQHGQKIEQMRAQGTLRPAAESTLNKKDRYCMAIDAGMIPGLPDPHRHRLDWHDVKLAVVFDPKKISPTFYIAGREDAQRFGKRLWAELESRRLYQDRFRLILGDGAPWIWNLVEMHLPGVPQLLDFYHAAQHLYTTATNLWPDSKALQWWHRRLAQLKEGHLANFFASLQWLARRYQNDDSEDSPSRLLRYFQDNRQRLDYRWAIINDLPIGSGPVESAISHVVQQRLKQSGMRWSDGGAQSVLNLRTLHRNGDFEQYWETTAAMAS
jgi:hypothetical protein